jgi:DNA-binding MurR/RpiR family transcriptional regulator
MAAPQRIEHHRTALTPSERRVADVVLAEPERVAFGTVAEVAARARTSGATVVRLATKLGFEGFVGLQSDVQDDLANRLRPAADRIRGELASDPVGRAAEMEATNVTATLAAVDRAMLRRAVDDLSARERRVWVLSGDASRGAALLFADHLGLLRADVQLLDGPDPRLARRLVDLKRGDALVVIDFRRYERWVVATVGRAIEAGARVIAVTDSSLSPLADSADATFVVRADAAGPFDSHTGTIAVLNLLLAAVATRLRRSATDRLDRIESAWQESLVDPSR